jgi:hypothetical protein
MPHPINRRNYYSGETSANLAAMLESMLGHPQWSQLSQQLAFNRAMNLYHHQNVTPTQRHNSRSVFRRLVRNYNRTWAVDPSSTSFQPIPQSNSNNNSAAHEPTAAPNYSKASNAVKKWLAMRPHTIHQNVVNIKLPANAQDPVNLYNFKPGNEAVMVIKKRLQKNGAMRSTRSFYKKNTIGSMAAVHRRKPNPQNNPVPWRTILRMKGSDVVFKDPLNRRYVYRRDIMNVKFVTPRS